MIYIIIFPAVAFLVMFILGVIMALLRFGPQICGVRHHAVPDIREWEEGRAYEHELSSA